MRAAYASDADFELADASAQEIAAMTAAMLERARVRALALYVCQRMGFNLEYQVFSRCSSVESIWQAQSPLLARGSGSELARASV